MGFPSAAWLSTQAKVISKRTSALQTILWFDFGALIKPQHK